MTAIAGRWDPDIVNNVYLTTSVNLMDGKFWNSKENVVLSSYKIFGSNRLRTWNHNLMVLAIYLFVFNAICVFKIQYPLKD